ncbi:hypothetical protein NDN08_008065 [Rhodosorus marinus]|uniref:Large ribosomal subunit protein uL15/eL18 domain-containing protein n=1 Tax=Rhodosorus marinus TaxID=101924 RepID=A0AAV8V3Q9_9RHOD|nr:hypothetical protein NDN08_008065 [Rhodosorus marinus]
MEGFVGNASVKLGGRAAGGYCGLRRNADGLSVAPRPIGASTGAATIEMKIFDWKKRGETGEMEIGEMSFTTLKPAPGSNQRKKRKGRGHSAGQGGSCGFGMRGQKSRSGRPSRPGFEGGQNPLYRRVPKYVGRPMGPGHSYTKYGLVKIEDLNKAEEGTVVTQESLQAAGIVTKNKLKLTKIVGGNVELTVKNLTVKAHAFTSSAVAAIEAAGGTCQLLNPTTNEDLEMDDDEEVEEVAQSSEE